MLEANATNNASNGTNVSANATLPDDAGGLAEHGGIAVDLCPTDFNWQVVQCGVDPICHCFALFCVVFR